MAGASTEAWKWASDYRWENSDANWSWSLWGIFKLFRNLSAKWSSMSFIRSNHIVLSRSHNARLSLDPVLKAVELVSKQRKYLNLTTTCITNSASMDCFLFVRWNFEFPIAFLILVAQSFRSPASLSWCWGCFQSSDRKKASVVEMLVRKWTNSTKRDSMQPGLHAKEVSSFCTTTMLDKI